LDPVVTRVVLDRMRQPATEACDDPFSSLTAQERRVVALVAEGKTNRDIGLELALSEFTVKTYVSRILKKLNLSRRVALSTFAVSRPLLAPLAATWMSRIGVPSYAGC